jgi:hypothetical protein
MDVPVNLDDQQHAAAAAAAGDRGSPDAETLVSRPSSPKAGLTAPNPSLNLPSREKRLDMSKIKLGISSKIPTQNGLNKLIPRHIRTSYAAGYEETKMLDLDR